MKKYKFLFFLFVIFLIPDVFALDFNLTNNITSPQCSGSQCSGGSYLATEIYNTGTQHTYMVNTRYQGTLSRIIYNLPLPSNYPDGDCFSPGLTYTVTMEMATDDWRNRFGTVYVRPYSSYSGNYSNGKVTYVSYRKIYFTFNVPSGDSCIDFVYIDLRSTNISSTAFTGTTNWNLNKITLSVPSSSGGSSGGSSGATNQDIINSNNSNTTNIINNNNDNTTNIINNNNDNTKEIIDNQKDLLGNCVSNLYNKNDIVSGHWLTSDNYINDDSTWSYSNYISIEGGKTYTSLYYGSSGSAASIVFYDSNYNYISGITHNNRNIITWNAPVNARFVRDSVPLSNIDTFMILQGTYSSHSYVPYGDKQCTSKIDETNNAINDVNNSINNPNIDSDVGEGFFDNFTNNMHGLSSIITIPLSSIQSLSSSQCTPLHFPIPFTDNKYLDVPCMTEIYQQHIPTLLTLIQTCWYGILAYKVLVNIFGIVKGFKDPDSDKIEVMDL